MKNSSSILRMYAITPCHAGSGSALGVVDLPIQRERHTQWPIIHSSGMKGAMRAHFDRYKHNIQEKEQIEEFEQLTDHIFGSRDKASDFAGSFSVSDAKILAFPMRSNVAPFVWITCPEVLKRLNKDRALVGKQTEKPEDLDALGSINKEYARWLEGSFKEGDKVLLEDVEVTCQKKIVLPNFQAFFKGAERLLIVHDEVFNYGVSHCTSVVAQISIDQATGTTTSGSLRYIEELPADTLMYAVIHWGDCRKQGKSLQHERIKKYLCERVMKSHLQVGGDETLGRGIFELSWIDNLELSWIDNPSEH